MVNTEPSYLTWVEQVLMELVDEWASNHVEHCTHNIPCLQGDMCGWKLPKTLQDLSPETLAELMKGWGSTYDLR